jgi:hypothetical protein
MTDGIPIIFNSSGVGSGLKESRSSMFGLFMNSDMPSPSAKVSRMKATRRITAP